MQKALENKYGMVMTVEDLADLTKSNKQTIYNKLYKDSLGIPYWRLGKKYLFSTHLVASYIEEQTTKR
jgi:excisionase family DNA binding protein